MAVRLYNEYIKVDPNFIPVFSRNSDRTYPDKWQSFYPHSSFKNILKDIVETLEKSNETKERKPKERKVDTEKLDLLNSIEKGLKEHHGVSATYENEVKLHFEYNGNKYSVTLTKHRK